MRAVVFAGPGAVRVDDVPSPVIREPGDAIVAVELSSICGSDLHLLHGKTPGMRVGGVIGHEFVGRVVETSDGAPQEGRRVVGSFLIACGRCDHCAARRFNHCRSRRALGLGTLTGDLDGAQAELVRVPNAGLNLKPLVGPLEAIASQDALFAGDILSTGLYAAALAAIAPGDRVVVIGAGPVGLLTAEAVRRRGPGVLLVLDADPARVAFASERLGLDARDVSDMAADAVVADATEDALADVAIDAVGSVPALKSAMRCVRDGGRVAVVGVYGAERYELPLGMTWVRGLDLRFAGMANVQAHWDEALEAIAGRELEPARLVTHRLPLEEAEEGYRLFESRTAMKVLLRP